MFEEFLFTDNISKSFGGIRALRNVTLKFEPGKTYCLIGPNGAGKTTLFNAITGIEKIDDGSIYFGNYNLVNMNIENIADIGIRRTFQQVKHFGSLQCNENLLLGAISKNKPSFWQTLLHPIQSIESLNSLIQEANLTLEKYGFDELSTKKVNNTSYGERKIVELLRCIHSGANILLLDEPLSGLQSFMKIKIIQILSSLSEEGKTIIIIEHNYKPVFEISDSVILMNLGEVILQDSPESIISHPLAKKIYIRDDKHTENKQR